MTEVMDESQILDCTYREEEVGKTIKKTKMRHIWEFTVKGKRHSVVFSDSKLSGRKTVEADGKVHFPKTLVIGVFSFSFNIEKIIISIVQIGTAYECRINSHPFSHLIEIQNNIKHFDRGSNSTTCTSSKIVNTKNENSKFSLNSYYRNKSLSDTNSPVDENKPFNFAIKPVDKGENRHTTFNFKKLEQFYNKMGNHSIKNDNSKLELIDFHPELKPSFVNLHEMYPSPKADDYILGFMNASLENQDNLNKDIDFRNKMGNEPINLNKKKLNDLDDLFDIFNNNNPNKQKENFTTPVKLNYDNISELVNVKDPVYFNPNDNDNIVYPSFDNFGKSKFYPQNFTPINLHNINQNPQPQLNQIIRDINDLFV